MVKVVSIRCDTSYENIDRLVLIITTNVTIHCHRLVLEDGSVWHGTAFGYTGVEGEYVFETFIFGYMRIFLIFID